MARIRAFENAAEEASKGGVSAFGAVLGNDARVRGPLHLSTGQEAVPAGVCINLATVAEELGVPVRRRGGARIPAGYSRPLEDEARVSAGTILQALAGK